MNHKRFPLTAGRVGLFTLLLLVSAFGQTQQTNIKLSPNIMPSPEDRQRLFEQRITECEQAVQDHPDDPNVWHNWGLILSVHGMMDETPQADSYFTQAAEKFARTANLVPGQVNTQVEWSHTLFHQALRHYDDIRDALLIEAVSHGRRATQLAPDNHEAWNILARSLALRAAKQQGPTADTLFAQAYDAFAQSIILYPGYYNSFWCWGDALAWQARQKQGPEADALFTQAYAKYQQAADDDPNMPFVWQSWGIALAYQARMKAGPQRQKLWREAQEKYQHIALDWHDLTAYNFACLYALGDDEPTCRQWLQRGEVKKTLPTRDHALNDEDITSVRDKEWFKAIKWKGE